MGGGVGHVYFGGSLSLWVSVRFNWGSFSGLRLMNLLCRLFLRLTPSACTPCTEVYPEKDMAGPYHKPHRDGTCACIGEGREEAEPARTFNGKHFQTLAVTCLYQNRNIWNQQKLVWIHSIFMSAVAELPRGSSDTKLRKGITHWDEAKHCWLCPSLPVKLSVDCSVQSLKEQLSLITSRLALEGLSSSKSKAHVQIGHLRLNS